MDNPGVKWGVYLGVTGVALSLILYLVNPLWMYQSVGALTGLVLSIAFLVMAGKEKRDTLGGYASFGQIFPTLFIASIISAVISLIFGYILVNFIDPGLIDVQKEAAMETSEWWMDLFGASGDAKDEALAATEEALEQQDIGGVTQMIQGLIGAGFFGAFISAILTLFIKKNNPEDV